MLKSEKVANVLIFVFMFASNINTKQNEKRTIQSQHCKS